MEHPGYPEDEEIEAVRNIDPSKFLDGAELLLELFESTGYGSGHITRFRGKARLYISTGGWSGCEELISAVNKFWWLMYWQRTERGGHYVFEGPR
ncbi:MAG TPA: hypothetical protein VLH56_11235 [Dissulfurispiraceae bacterium]|nr:hypothetical protein [Dissulfurispiraceae bacterium]